MKNLFKEPLVHFLFIGAGLFLLFGIFNNPAEPQSSRIVISTGQIDYLKANFTRTWQRSPTEQELQGLIDSYIREEIFYREALAMGLDRDDSVIRRRLKQKLEIMSDDLAGVAMPSDEDLRQFLSSHPESFRYEPQIAFRHIYLNTDQRGNSAMDEAVRLLDKLSTSGNKINPDMLGDSFILPKSFDLSSVSGIAGLFGERFSAEIMKIKPGHWAGPIMSGYGLHLVLVSQKIEGRLPELAEVREEVEREWFASHRKKLKEVLYKKLREKYTIVFELSGDKGDPTLAQTVSQPVKEQQ
jgi:hypothetical protein